MLKYKRYQSSKGHTIEKSQEQLDIEQSNAPKNSKGEYLIFIKGSTAHQEHLNSREVHRIEFERRRAVRNGIEKEFQKYFNDGEWQKIILLNNYYDLKRNSKYEKKILLGIGIFIGFILRSFLY